MADLKEEDLSHIARRSWWIFLKMYFAKVFFIVGRQRNTIIGTFLAEYAVLMSNLLVLRLAADSFGTVGFGEYTVARRAIGLVTFPLLCGLGISLPRFIAQAEERKAEIWQQRAYFFSGLVFGLILLTLFWIPILTIPDLISRLFYGDSAFSHLVPPIALCITGLYLHTIFYGYFRGRLQMGIANFLQVSNMGLIPLLAIGLSQYKVENALVLMGMGWLIVSAMAGAWIALRLGVWGLSFSDLLVSGRTLIVYGVPRIPGEFALFGLFAVPTFIVAWRYGVERAGFFSLGTSLIQLVSSMFTPIGILLLPYTSRLVAAHRWDAIRGLVTKVLLGTLIVAGLIIVLMQLSLPKVLFLLAGPSFSVAAGQLRWLLAGTVPYMVYITLRNPLDAIAVWPHNSINLMATLFLIAGLIGFLDDRLSAEGIMALGLSLLAVFSWLSWQQSLKHAQISSMALRDTQTTTGGGSDD